MSAHTAHATSIKTKRPSKSYWQECSIHDQKTIKSWFGGLADDINITKAEILCDVDTDREKKLRVFGERGTDHYILTRTMGNKFSISCKHVNP
jgi:hypothetical protein